MQRQGTPVQLPIASLKASRTEKKLVKTNNQSGTKTVKGNARSSQYVQLEFPSRQIIENMKKKKNELWEDNIEAKVKHTGHSQVLITGI